MSDLKVYVVLVDDSDGTPTQGRVATVNYSLNLGGTLDIRIDAQEMVFFDAEGWVKGDQVYITAQPHPHLPNTYQLFLRPSAAPNAVKFEAMNVVELDATNQP